MADFSTTDPFTQVHNALWTALEAEADFTAAVPAGNRIKYTGSDRSPEKRNHTTYDFPDVRVKPAGGPFSVPGRGASSLTSFALKRWRVQVATGDQRVDEALFQIQWAAMKAIVNTDNLGLDFVHNLYFEDVTEADVSTEHELNQWATVLTLVVEMQFVTDTDFA